MPQQASKTIKQPFPIESPSLSQYKSKECYWGHSQVIYTAYYHA